MCPASLCPTHQQLSEYVLGKLSATDSDTVARHFGSCDDCLWRLENVDQSADSMVQMLRNPTPDDDFMREPQCQLVVADGRRLASGLEVDLGFLRDYRLVKKLGKGGMGTVYSAVHTKLDRSVAIKLLPADRMLSADAVSRFEREMKAIGKLHHRNIVQAYDAGEADGKHYLVMELVQGLDLSTLVNRMRTFSVADACEIIRQAATGLQHAHERDLVHRDIKPSNIMVTLAGEVKILDLGLARLEEAMPENRELTSTGQIMGTLDYMAPEQLGDSHDVDLRADIYSLGASLYKLLTGQAPYADKKYNTPQKKLMAIATKPVKSIREFRDDVPDEVVALLDDMMAKNPDERFATAAEILEAVSSLASGNDLAQLVATASAQPEPTDSKSTDSNSTFDYLRSAFVDTDRLPESTTPVTVAPTSLPLSGRTPFWRSRRPVAAGLAVLAAGFALTVFFVISGKVTLLVEVDDDQVAVELKKHGLIVRDKKTGRQYAIWSPGENKLNAGDYSLSVTDDAGLRVDTDAFTLTRGGRQIVRVQLDEVPNSRSDTQDDNIDQDNIEDATGTNIVETTEPLSPMALVTRPAKLAGVKSWSIETVVPRGHKDNAFQAGPAISPDGKLAAMTTQDGVVRIYELGSGQLLHAWLGQQTGGWGVDWSPDQRLLATVANSGNGGGRDRVHVWRYPSGQLVESMDLDPALGLAWSTNRPLLAIGGSTLRLWEEGSGLRLAANAPQDVKIWQLAWSPDGKLLAMGGSDPRIHLWSLEDQRIIRTLGENVALKTNFSARSIAWSPDGHALASRTLDNVVRIWNIDTGGVIKSIEGINFDGLAWSPDANSLALCEIIDGDHYITLWNATSFAKSDTRLHLESQNSIRFGLNWPKDGSTLAAFVPGGGLRAYDMPAGKLRFAIDEIRTFMNSWSSSGILFSTPSDCGRPSYNATDTDWGYDGHMLWDPMAGEQWRLATDVPHGDVAIPSPSGRFVASWFSRDVLVFQEGALGRKRGMESNIWNAAWSPDGKQLAVGTKDEIYVWDVIGDRILHQFEAPVGGPRTVACALSTKLAVADHSGNIHLWDLDKETSTTSMTHDEGGEVRVVTHLEFSPDGEYIASASHNWGCINIWNTSTGERLRSLRGFPGVLAVKWSDENSLSCVSNDGSLRTWHIEDDLVPAVNAQTFLNGQDLSVSYSPKVDFVAIGRGATRWVFETSSGSCVAAITGIPDGHVIQISPDGHYFASADATDAIVYCVETDSGKRLTLSQQDFETRYGWTNYSEKGRSSIND